MCQNVLVNIVSRNVRIDSLFLLVLHDVHILEMLTLNG